ncbi:hypothetical protein [Pseudoalteromonas rubra]|uniref:PKD domain-containing protein n=1 Tax=Pseudoalteromonas rubra TaxID=43658 RepID=A0A0F4QZF0_9GAMM|nr:hypothetical protein [Pseudoalteromonas rubra]KJZ12645.1 hypothetical protein TW77_02360 [Pseudoalteromonas rubra]
MKKLNFKKSVALICLGILGAKAQAIPLEKVRHCTTPTVLLPCLGKTQHEYRHWENNGVKHEVQKRTYIMRYNTPSANDTEHLVFIASGQRSLDGSSYQNFITGNTQNFDNQFSRTDNHVQTFSFSSNALPELVRNSGVYSPSNSFIASAWDSRFNWESQAYNKHRVVNAYYDWLKTKFKSSRLKSIYLAGHSRGGALVTRLAQRFKSEFPDIPLVLHLFDPVGNHVQQELVTDRFQRVKNPTTSEWQYWSYRADFNSLFPNKKNLRVLNQVGGKAFMPEWMDDAKKGIRSLADATPGTNSSANDGAWYFEGQSSRFSLFDAGTGADWYTQNWYHASHTEFASRDWATNVAFNHLMSSDVRTMIADYTNSRPPIPSCDGYVSRHDDNGATIRLTGSNFGGDNEIRDWRWQFNNGTTQNGTKNPTVQIDYWRFSGYRLEATLQVTSHSGKTASTTCSITLPSIKNPPR